MSHTHDYETIKRMSVSSEASGLGIEGAELRRCRECECETVFLLGRGKWFALHEECEGSGKDILLA